LNVEGERVRKTVAVQLGAPADGRQRLTAAGLSVNVLAHEAQVTGVRFGSQAKKSGFEQGWMIGAVKVPSDRPSRYWVFGPAVALVALVFFSQRARLARDATA
jgi:hypothetical protein